MTGTEPHGWYAYGITSHEAEPPADLRGLDDAPVRTLGAGELRLLVSELRRSPEDLQQAGPDEAVEAVRRHDAVLSAFAAAAPVLPMRFGTVMPHRSAADRLLHERAHDLRDALDTVAGASEWVVQVDRREAADEPEEDETTVERPGHAFFARKRTQRNARAGARASATRAAERLEEDLAALARAVRPLAPRDAETVSRIAYLVDEASTDAFLATATAEDADVAVHGPLPAYRFAGEAAP